MHPHLTVITIIALLAFPFLLPDPAGASCPAPETLSPQAVSNWGVELIGQVGGAISGVAVQDQRAYVGRGMRLAALDISDPQNPVLLDGTPPFSSMINGVAVFGTHAYAVGTAGFFVVDISNPSNLRVIASTDAGGLKIAVSGNLAVIANGNAGLSIINIDNPAAPVRLSGIDTPGSATNVAMSGHLIFVADSSGGLRVISVQNPAVPVEVGAISFAQAVNGVAVAGHYAYVTAGSQGLRVVDIGNPTTPTEAGFFITAGTARAVALGEGQAEGLAYVATDWKNGLRVIDVRDPAHIVEVGSDPDVITSGVTGIAFAQSLVVLIADGRGGLHLITVGAPAAPGEIGRYQDLASAWDVTVANGYAYMTSQSFQILDVHSPAWPQRRGAFAESGGGAGSLAVVGNTAYVPDSADGMRILDVVDPDHPVQVGRYDSPGLTAGVTVQGKYAYVADAQAGLQVVDVSNPHQPQWTSGLDTPGTAVRAVISGTLAYVADLGGGIRIVDISNPMTPRELGSYATSGRDAAPYGSSYLYVADQDGRQLRVLDISNPASPVKVGAYSYVNNPMSIAIRDHYLALVDGVSLHIFDIATPADPQLMAYYYLPGGWTSRVQFDGAYLYVATGAGPGLAVFWFAPSATAVVPVVGGGLTSSFDGTNYVVSANTFTDTVKLQHQPMYTGNLPSTGLLMPIGNAFEVSAIYADRKPASPSQPIAFSVPYRPSELGPVDESTLGLYYYDGRGWVLESTSQVDTLANAVTATPNHLSLWAVMGEPAARLFLPMLHR